MSGGAMAGASAAPRWVARRRGFRGVLPLLSLGLFAWCAAEVWTSDPELAGGRVAETAIAALLTLPLAVADRWPLPAGLLVFAGAGLDYWLGGSLGQAWFATLVAVYVLADRAGAAARAVGMAAVAALTLAVDLPRLRDDAPLDEVLPGWLIVGAVYGLGRWVSTRRADQARLHERALAAEADREEATRAAVAHERALIARELHDLVGHSLSVIVLQAQAGQRVLDSEPVAARSSLGAIEGLGRDGMAELRRLLGIMGEAPDDAGGSAGLENLEALVARVRAAGLPVDLSVELAADARGAYLRGPDGQGADGRGADRALPAGLDLTAYRIVQEALTNSLRHAGPATARVAVSRRGETLTVSVVDTGRGMPDAGDGVERAGTEAGRGLIGMRERTALYGGTLVAGPRDGGGFEVTARFPVDGVDGAGGAARVAGP
ncbi:histidine kinase [Knoellia locipacati]|uniref:sensor histidine kinase n=1 Tax=Knoellia locipacati TaxID=882824 RepID=UPI00384AC931